MNITTKYTVKHFICCYTVEYRLFEPPRDAKMGSRNPIGDFDKSKVRM